MERSPSHRLALAALALVAVVTHDGPDPVWHWLATAERVEAGGWAARFGPTARLVGGPVIHADEHGESLAFDGRDDRVVVADDLATVREQLPKRALTIAAWVAIESPQKWGGIFGAVQDNGDAERGLVLGYDEERFTFGLATVGGDDGDGRITYLRGTTRWEPGRLHHVVATYDGVTQRLYVNGSLDGKSDVQSGDVLWPDHAPITIGSYTDRDEDFPLHGRIRELSVHDLCAEPAWVAREFLHDAALAASPAVRTWPDDLRFVVTPYLQFVTEDGITVLCETSRPARATVRYGEDETTPAAVVGGAPTTLHELRLTELATGTNYFYRVELEDDRGQRLEHPLLSFQTAVTGDTPFAFAVIADTQDNPAVAGRIAAQAFGQRPNFALIPGDLVGTGSNKAHWTDAFFPSMRPLVERVAFFPVLGNHEQDARHYYDYVSVPAPEHRYAFRYGNAEFFVVDTNRDVGPDSEQYRWLDAALAASDATWRFVSHHHPAYSSDENDYGDLWKGRSTLGDLRVRQLTALYDRHRVDVVFNGHIHSYERTWPIREGRVAVGGTVYMVTGGGGGSLETPGPTRPWFQNHVRRGHHYCIVAIAGRRLEFRAFDLDDRLFDVMTIEK